MSGLAIEARSLTRVFGPVKAVDGVDLSIASGTIYGFLGPNGSGKSTTLRMLCGLLTPTSGSIRVLGFDIPRQAEALRLKIGYMTQRFSLWEDLTVGENLAFMAEVHTLGRASADARIAELSRQYRLGEFFDRLAGTLSGGQKQRLALAAATLHQPALLLLDEPTSAVDPQSRRDFWESLFELAAGGTTVLVSTHYMDEAERCHELAIMQLGRIAAQGEPSKLMRELPLAVVEIEAADVQAARHALADWSELRSLTQLGLKLHALIAPEQRAPLAAVEQRLRGHGVRATARQVEANLEDVFVGVTRPELTREYG